MKGLHINTWLRRCSAKRVMEDPMHPKIYTVSEEKPGDFCSQEMMYLCWF
jgi:hypothetical protein